LRRERTRERDHRQRSETRSQGGQRLNSRSRRFGNSSSKILDALVRDGCESLDCVGKDARRRRQDMGTARAVGVIVSQAH
jgi:hypothetical protein